jgi:hypothetical protein
MVVAGYRSLFPLTTIITFRLPQAPPRRVWFMNPRLPAILAANVAGYVISTYECSQFRTEFAADSPVEGRGFELAVPREVAFVPPRQPDASQGGSVSKVQPTGIKQLASSSDISTMRSSPIVICRPEKVWTAPIPGGALMRT